MSKIGKEMPKEYSDKFDELRQNRMKLVNALESMELCVKKYKDTGNTEYLCDAANYLMFEYMYPQKEGAYFKATDSKDSAGVAGTPVKELYSDKHFDAVTKR